MAKSKYEYVKKFEVSDICLPNCWIVVRIDGRNFHRFSDEHHFVKPNDIRCLSLMNKCAKEVMEQFHDICLSYGQSDEYSFVFKRKTTQFGRRENKLMSNIVSLFSSSFVFYWDNYFNELKLRYPPVFDSRTVVYPSLENIRDYLAWRQVDCHINNLYNTCFWALVQNGNYSKTNAENKLKSTLSSDKNEILFTEFGINYNNEPAIYKKGTIQIRKTYQEIISGPDNNIEVETYRTRNKVVELHIDMITDQFWQDHPVLD